MCNLNYILVISFVIGITALSVKGQTASELIISTPNLVGFWDFSEDAGNARLSNGTSETHALIEQGGPIQRFAEGPLSGYSAYLNGSSQFFSIAHELTGDLNISGTDAQVSMVAFIKQTRVSKTIAGMWSEGSGAGDTTGVRQYALLQDMPLYGGNNKVTPHISAYGGPSRREDGSYLPWNVDYAASKSTVAINEWVSVGFTYDGEWVKAFYNGAFEQWNASASSLGRTDSYFTQEGPDGGWRGINAYYQPDGIYTFDPDDPAKMNEGAPFTVGARQAVGKPVAEPFQGYFGGLAVFDRALTEDEMHNIHTTAFSQFQLPTPEPTYAFEEGFTHNGASNASVNDFNASAGKSWHALWGANAQTSDNTSSGEGIRISDSTIHNGNYAAFVPGGSDEIGLIWTDGISLDSVLVDILSVTLNNKSTDDAVRFAVQIDGQWFVTDAVFGTDPAGVGYSNWVNANDIQWQWTGQASAWRELIMAPGSQLALGTMSSSDLSGNIEAFGLLGHVASDGLIRADDVQITTVPEPATIALLSIGAAVIFRKRNRLNAAK